MNIIDTFIFFLKIEIINQFFLSQVMQTNVPQPFKVAGDVSRSGHLGMPGGQWAQNDKYIASDLHDNQMKVESSLKSKIGTNQQSGKLFHNSPIGKYWTLHQA